MKLVGSGEYMAYEFDRDRNTIFLSRKVRGFRTGQPGYVFLAICLLAKIVCARLEMRVWSVMGVSWRDT